MLLEELRKLEAAATPGPWTHESEDLGNRREHWIHIVAQPRRGSNVFLDWVPTEEKPWFEWTENHRQGGVDAALIAAMRNALPDLLAIVEAAKALRLPNGHAIHCMIHVDRECGSCSCGWEEAADFRAALAKLEGAK